nr:EOG090X02H9 [Eulimnadia texana]
MEQELANRLFEEGAFLVFTNVPVGTEFGIDMNTWNTGEKFKGVKLIPPGLHFVYYSAVSKDGQVAPRTGFFHFFKKQEIVAKKWVATDEDFEDITDEEEIERFRANLKNLDPFLGAYPLESWKKWVSLSNKITGFVLDKIEPLKKKISSVADLIPGEKQKTSELRLTRQEKEDQMLPSMQPRPGTELRFTAIPANPFPEGATAAERTRLSLDSSFVLDTILTCWNKSVFESFARELLIVKQYRVEIYSPKTSGRNCNDWFVQYQASPGNLVQIEDLIFTNADITTATGVVAIKIAKEGSDLTVGCCYIDTNERSILVSQFSDNESFSNLESFLVQLGPKESVIPISEEYIAVKQVLKRSGLLICERKKADFSGTDVARDLNKLLKFKKGQQENAAALPQTELIHSVSALAAVIKYLNLISDESNANQFTIATFDLTQYVRLDSAAVRALHLSPSGSEGSDSRTTGTAPRSLQALLNKCRTAGGQRLLSQWIKQPLMDKEKINERLDIVEAFVEDVQLRQSVSEDHLRRIPDLQRLSKKLQRKRATLQDCYRLYQAIKRLPPLCSALQQYEGPHSAVLTSVFREPLERSIEQLSKFVEMVESTMDLQQAEQGDFVIRADFVEGLGELRSQMDDYEAQMQTQLTKVARDLNLEAQKTVKLESNAQLGYFFRVTLKDEKALRNNRSYRTIDTNKNGVRFRNSALQDLNEQYLGARQQYESEQQAVVQEVLGVAEGKRFYIITGPNMGGKSTYIRHIAKDICSYGLFATHFHELTSLEDNVGSVTNVHVSALTGDNTLTLLYRVQPGSCDQSFGIHVAELVSFPPSALEVTFNATTELVISR